MSKSANYCAISSLPGSGYLLLCEVALGESWQLSTAKTDIVTPRAGAHSVKGVGMLSPNPKGCTSFERSITVPSGELGMQPLGPDDVKPTHLMYNEYIVYSSAQQRPRFLVELHFDKP